MVNRTSACKMPVPISDSGMVITGNEHRSREPRKAKITSTTIRIDEAASIRLLDRVV